MTDPLILLAPLLLLLLAIWFGFVGCSSFGEAPAEPPKVDPAKPVPYKDVLANTPGFVAHWPLDDSSGNTAVANSGLVPKPNGTYTVTGVTLADDKSGALAHKGNVAPLFDGANGYVDVPYRGPFNPAANLSFSIELWMKPKPGAVGANQVLVSSRQSGNASQRRGYDLLFVREQNQPQPIVRARVFAPNVNETEVSVPLTQGDPLAWRHIVCVYEGSATPKLTLSVGVIGLANPIRIDDNTNVAYAPVAAPGSTLRFGAGHKPNGDAQNFFAGWLDEIAFYNVALSASDIDAHFKAATAPS